MLTTYIESYKTLIFAKNGDMQDIPVGYLVDFVIDPDSGIIRALWGKSFESKENLLLAPRDILYWNLHEIEISDETDLVLPENFPNIQSVLALEVPIINANILTEKTNKILGKVTNFSFDTNDFKLLSISTNSGFLFWKKQKIYLKKQIAKINENGIFIKDLGIKLQ